MTPIQLEREVVRLLGESGAWATRLAPDSSGQQPFDIIAVKGDIVLGIDAKLLLTGKSFPFSRIEVNQRRAMERLLRAKPDAVCGFVIWQDYVMYWLPYHLTLDGNSIKLERLRKFTI